jgi:hypothetical protein
MPITILHADETILFADAGDNSTTRIRYDGANAPARIFQRDLGEALWEGPLDLEQKAFEENKSPTERAKAKIQGDFLSDELSPGKALQYGMLPRGVDRDRIDPTSKAVDDAQFDHIVTIACLLKQPGEQNFIKDGNESTGGTFRFRQIDTNYHSDPDENETFMVIEVLRRRSGP